jgi:hypothetical protein
MIAVQQSAGDLPARCPRDTKYIGELTGVRPDIGEPTAIADLPKDQVLILVGGPEANPLVKKAVTAGQLDSRGLNPEGFLLKTTEEVGGRPVLVLAAMRRRGRFTECMTGWSGKASSFKLATTSFRTIETRYC